MSAMNINRENFSQEVLNADKPVLLDFWAPWCGPCRMVVPIVEQIAAENPQYTVGKINVDDDPDRATRFGVMSIPTLIVFKNGEEASRIVGARPKAAILAELA